MNLIYQIGRFDPKFLNKLNFKIEGKDYFSSLTGLAYREFIKENKQEEAKLVLVFPASLLINKGAIENIPENYADFKQKLSKFLDGDLSEKESYYKNPYPYFKLHPHSKEADGFTVIHSLGEFGRFQFDATFDELVLEIFLDIVSRYRERPFNKLFIDISSGLNFHVTALLEGAKLFYTFYKLQNFLKDHSPLEVYLIFSDPIIGAPTPSKNFYEIHKTKLDVKTFFEYPQKPEGINVKIREDKIILEQTYDNFIKSLATINDKLDENLKREFKEKLNPLFSYGYLFYSAIKNNVPLVLYTFKYDNLEKIEDGITFLITKTKDLLSNTFQKPAGLEVDSFKKAFFMLALYKGIVKALKEKGITQKPEVTVAELKAIFIKDKPTLYDSFNLLLNSWYLGRELHNNFIKDEIKVKFTSEYKPLTEFIEGKYEGGCDKADKRNFLAHCGFERTCVEVKKDGETIYLRYKPGNETKKKILEILFEI
ncbi:MAG TPA: TIGR01897 family CRISPR-associated protein [Thermodesulfobacterium commune]|nr:TIGR01897 family CRISPR-associated protein [Thermodesulfobacterium commune]HCP09961.1 TIGR01897 family CRISPR-associated protein [Thermodesulfobacterium commune]